MLQINRIKTLKWNQTIAFIALTGSITEKNHFNRINEKKKSCFLSSVLTGYSENKSSAT